MGGPYGGIQRGQVGAKTTIGRGVGATDAVNVRSESPGLAVSNEVASRFVRIERHVHGRSVLDRG